MNEHQLGGIEEPTPFELKVRRGVKRGQPIRVVEISHTPSPDADERLGKALGLLLRAATRAEEKTDSKAETKLERTKDDGK